MQELFRLWFHHAFFASQSNSNTMMKTMCMSHINSICKIQYGPLSQTRLCFFASIHSFVTEWCCYSSISNSPQLLLSLCSLYWAICAYTELVHLIPLCFASPTTLFAILITEINMFPMNDMAVVYTIIRLLHAGRAKAPKCHCVVRYDVSSCSVLPDRFICVVMLDVCGHVLSALKHCVMEFVATVTVGAPCSINLCVARCETSVVKR